MISTKPNPDISAERLMETIHRICSFGIRFAGSGKEQECADWIEEKFRELGLTEIHQHRFPCPSFEPGECTLEVKQEGSWQSVESEPAAHSPSTPPEGIRGDLVVVEKIPGSQKAANQMMRHKVLLLQCSELFQIHRLKRTMKARPTGILLVDDRFPNNWTVAIGFPRYWIDFLSCPITVSYTHLTLPTN